MSAFSALRRQERQDTIGTLRRPKLERRRRAKQLEAVAGMSDTKPPDKVLPDQPVYRPLERFWPYADLSEAPSDEELADLHPDLRAVLFGARDTPFSISIEFAEFEGEAGARAAEMARASDEHLELEVEGTIRHRARFAPGDRPLRIRDLYEAVGARPGTDVLIDDRPVPFARELWLPLVWFLIR
jgi:hypothetical protein